jgi:hypothetical protein
VAAGLGEREQARRELERVRREFCKRRNAYDAALVSLDLAILHLSAGHAAKVAALAEEMVWVFSSKGIHREALAALRLFVQSAQAGLATEELARHLVSFLERARHDRRLHFEGVP